MARGGTGTRGRRGASQAAQPARPVGPGVMPRVLAPPPHRGPPDNVPPAAPAAAAIQAAAEAAAARAGLADIARASHNLDGPGGEGGHGSDADEDFNVGEPLFSLEDIPVSRRSGEHARAANEGAPELIFDKIGVSFLLTNFSRHCYS